MLIAEPGANSRMTTRQNPKRQTPDPKEIPNCRWQCQVHRFGGEDCVKVEGFKFQLFFGVWTLAFVIYPRQHAPSWLPGFFLRVDSWDLA
jgi:hypothetical protein